MQYRLALAAPWVTHAGPRVAPLDAQAVQERAMLNSPMLERFFSNMRKR